MKKWISKYSRIYTNKFSSYLPIKKQFPNIEMKVFFRELAEINLPIVHQTIGNFKGDLIGIYSSISQLHLQNYQDEFCYKLNRRFMLEKMLRYSQLDSSGNTLSLLLFRLYNFTIKKNHNIGSLESPDYTNKKIHD